MPDIKEVASSGRLLEALGAGTAAVVSPIECIQYKSDDIMVDDVVSVTQRICDELTVIQYGKIQGPEGWSITF